MIYDENLGLDELRVSAVAYVARHIPTVSGTDRKSMDNMLFACPKQFAIDVTWRVGRLG